jgi:nucleoside phosphorylase
MTTRFASVCWHGVRGLTALVLCGGVALVGTATTDGARATPSCIQRTLVLSAMPVELSPLLGQAKIAKTVAIGGREFFVGRLRGHSVVLALTGIGPVNARRTTRTALKHFRCGHRPGIDAVIFSGVAGGDFIGDVIVATRWTMDAGKHFFGVNRRMLAAARRVVRGHVSLERKTPVGDPLCTCAISPDLIKTVTVTHKPRIEIGGTGQTTDPFGGKPFPCVPGGGDVFGCDPCPANKNLASEAAHFLPGIEPLLNPSFFAGYLSATSSEGDKYVVEDEETAAVDAVATAHHVPFLGIRAVSDGGGDPLRLPGFPAEFFYYRQLAADNAALTTLAFLSKWRISRDSGR